MPTLGASGIPILQNRVYDQVHEVNPARSPDLLGLPSKKYKGHKISFKDGHWIGGVAAEIAQSLVLMAEEGETLNDDELDAIICAVTGVVEKGGNIEVVTFGRIGAARYACDIGDLTRD